MAANIYTISVHSIDQNQKHYIYYEKNKQAHTYHHNAKQQSAKKKKKERISKTRNNLQWNYI